MEAIILAGGLGTRLQSVVSEVPKPMALVNNIPFLEYILKYLKRHSIKKVIFSVGYKWKVISEYFGSSFEGIEIIYSVENEPLGTGGAIKKAMEYTTEECVFIFNGDTYFDINPDVLIQAMDDNFSITLALKSLVDFDRYGCVEVDDNGIVISFTEKGHREFGYINGGIYLVKNNLFKKFNLPNKFSFEDFLEENVQSLNIHGTVFDNYFIDIGIPEDFKRSQTDLTLYV